MSSRGNPKIFQSRFWPGLELIYEINNISLREPEAPEMSGCWAREVGGGVPRYTFYRKTHKAAYVSSVMRTGDFSFRVLPAIVKEKKINVAAIPWNDRIRIFIAKKNIQ